MAARLIYSIILLGLLFVACEDVYIPKLDETEDLLVIEAKVTNSPDQNLIRISKTLNFYEEGVAVGVFGAEVFLIDNEGLEMKASDSGNGYYQLNYSAKPGAQYQLKITIGNSEYESEFELMPPLPVIDEFDVKADTVTSYTYSTSGEPIRQTTKGVKAVVDLPLNDELSHYLFQRTMVLEYIINFEAFMIPPPPIYGWKTFKGDQKFTIAGPPEFGDVEKIHEFQTAFNSSDLSSYLSTDIFEIGLGPNMVGWILILDQFGISEKTFNFYKTLNAQLEAEGKLFDPVFPQIYSNVKCVTNPNEKVIGYFEVSSHNEARYFYSSSVGREAWWYEFDEVNIIPYSGQLQQTFAPDWWEHYGKRPYGPLPKPND